MEPSDATVKKVVTFTPSAISHVPTPSALYVGVRSTCDAIVLVEREPDTSY